MQLIATALGRNPFSVETVILLPSSLGVMGKNSPKKIVSEVGQWFTPATTITDAAGLTNTGSEETAVGQYFQGGALTGTKERKQLQAMKDADDAAHAAGQQTLAAMKPDPNATAQASTDQERDRLRRMYASRSTFTGGTGLSSTPSTASAVLLGS